MTNTPTRQHQRYSVAFAVEIKAQQWDEVLHLTTDNVSRGGLFIRAAQPVPEGTQIMVTLGLPDETLLQVAAEVVHVVTAEQAAARGMASGFGLRFEATQGADLDLLEAMAAAHVDDASSSGRQEGDVISVPARLLRSDGQIEEGTANRLVQLSALQARVQQAKQGTGTYTIVLPNQAIVDLPPSREAVFEVAEAEIAEMRSGDAAPADSPSDPPQELTGAQKPTAPQQPQKGSGQSTVYGIDFGTTYSCIAAIDGTQLRIFEDEERITMFPSTVCFLEDGTSLVGWPAREKAVFNPTTTFKSPKRLLGRRRDDPQVEALLASSSLRTSAGPDGEVVSEIFGELISVPQVCAEVFRHLVAVVARSGGAPVEQVVLSAPTGYLEERADIRRAAELAGLDVIWMQDEPVAAAMAFGLGRRDQTIAVYDFGGGTFDFTLVRIAGGHFEVAGEAGDPWLGGDDFDRVLADHAADVFERQHAVDLRQRKVEWQRLLFHCESAKRRLSSEEETLLDVRSIVLSVRKPIDLKLRLDREICEGLWSGLVDRSIVAVEECHALAGVEPAQVDAVLMTGGVSRIPVIRRRVQQLYGREGASGIDPEHAVVSGNAIHGRFVSLASPASQG